MGNCDFRTIRSMAHREILKAVHSDLSEYSTLEEKLHWVEDRISDRIPCITDEYSKLRYALFFLRNLINGGENNLSFDDPNGIRRSSVQGMCFSEYLRRGGRANALLERAEDIVSITAVLRSIVESRVSVDPEKVLHLLGRSEYIDALVRDVVRAKGGSWDGHELRHCIRKRILEAQEIPQILTVLFDIASEHKLEVLSDARIDELLRRWEGDTQVFIALLRYIGEIGMVSLLPVLQAKLEKVVNLPPSMSAGIIDVLAQVGNGSSLKALDHLRDGIAQIPNPSLSELFRELIDLAVDEIRWRHRKSHKSEMIPGPVLVQCVFYGDIHLPGQAGGGGIATLLNNLGRSMAGKDRLGAIYTLFLLPLAETIAHPHLLHASGNKNHWIVRVPVSFPPSNESYRFMIREYEIMRAVRRALERHRIDPDIFHVRYSDNASKAVMHLAKKLGKRVVFTLTSDPHRSFVDRTGRMLPMSEPQVVFNMNKVFIADRLVKDVDGLVLIGHAGRNEQILPYFPELWLEPEVRRKPVEVLAEGIVVEVPFDRDESSDRYIDLLLNHRGRYRIQPSYLNRSVLLNVGRLNPMKGQHWLVEAWANSRINKQYNLVLIGGNLARPDDTERRVIKYIDRLMEGFPHLEGRFCHLGALPNRKVRLLEGSIMEEIRTATPNIYVCSSYKEEFGISILEAMSVGFLVLAPRNGGVSSYIQSGKNGFLIDTHSSESLRRGMESMLGSAGGSQGELHGIAKRGMEFVITVFDIERVADDFTAFYKIVMQKSQRGSSR